MILKAYRPTDYYYKVLALEEEVKSLQNHINLLQEQCWKAQSQNSCYKTYYIEKTAKAIEKLKKQLKDGEFEAVAHEIRLLKANQQERQDEEFQLMAQTKKWKERHDSEQRKRMAAVAENDLLRQKLADKHAVDFEHSKAGVKEVKQTTFQPIRRMANFFSRNKKEQPSTFQGPSASTSAFTKEKTTVEKELPAVNRDSSASTHEHSANESTPLISKASSTSPNGTTLAVNGDSPTSTQERFADESTPLISKVPTVTSNGTTTLVATSRRNSSLSYNPPRNGNFPVDKNGALIRTCGRTSVLDEEAARRNFEDAYVAEEEEVVVDPFVTPESDRSRRSVRMSLQEALREDSLHREAVARMNEG